MTEHLYNKLEQHWFDTLAICADLSEKAHTGQKRWGGQDYFSHPKAIAKVFIDKVFLNRNMTTGYTVEHVVEDLQCACVAYLHDVLEDCPDYTPDVLLEQGVPHEIVWNVIILTKLKGEKYLPYLLRVKNSGSKVALIVKLADIDHNLSDLDLYDETKKMIDRYQMAQWILKTH